jgi:hypothetical protein
MSDARSVVVKAVMALTWRADRDSGPNTLEVDGRASPDSSGPRRRVLVSSGWR